MKKKIGFIDLHIDEWHANNYPAWFRGAKRADEFELYMACEESPGAGRPLAQWCQEFGVKPAGSIEEVVRECDVLCVLAPSNPEVHERLAELPLKSGKPVYIDKPFAPDRAAAERMFALAAKHNTPMFSSSALRFSTELMAVREELSGKKLDTMISWGGGTSFWEYAIHQLEMIVSTLGVGVKRVMRSDSESTNTLLMEYADGRRATLTRNPRSGFGVGIFGAESAVMVSEMSRIFENLIDAMLDFYTTGVAPVDSRETIEIAGVLDAAIRAEKQDGVWMDV